jgi:hypothetical protein
LICLPPPWRRASRARPDSRVKRLASVVTLACLALAPLPTWAELEPQVPAIVKPFVTRNREPARGRENEAACDRARR